MIVTAEAGSALARTGAADWIADSALGPVARNGGSGLLVVLAVGKLGGREPNYHSDLDVIFLFDHEGMTKSLMPNRRFEPTTNRHFFNQLS